jgi:xanthine/uracil permease
MDHKPAGSLKGVLKSDSFWRRSVPIAAGVIALYIGILVMLKPVFESLHGKILGGCGVLMLLPLAAVFVTVS